MHILITAALLAAPASTGAADQDAVCAVGLADTAAYAKQRPGLSAEGQASLAEGAEFFMGVLVGRYGEAELGDVFAAAFAELAADRKRQELVTSCFGRRDRARAALRAGSKAAVSKMPGSGKSPKQPR